MSVVKLAVATKKCSTCDRWNGPRRHVDDRTHVEVDDNEDKGLCVGGPWDGNVRHPLTRCGRWIQWMVEQ